MKAKDLFPDTEPTLYDVIDAMQGGFSRIELKLTDHDVLFEEIRQEMQGVRQRLFKVELKLEDKSDTILNHEERLGSLEVWRKSMGKRGMAGA